MSTTHPGYGVTPAPQPPEAGKPNRPWYKKKRFIIPILFVLFIGWIGSLGDDEPTGTAAPATVEQETETDEPTAEELAAQEAEAAAKVEADRVAAEQKAADDAAKAEADRVAAEQAAAAAAAAEAAKGTPSQQNAYAQAKDYLDFQAFSRAGLLDQLTSEFGGQFPAGDAEFAIARIEAEGGVDWNEQAAKQAKDYLEFQSFSRAGLLDQLTSEFGGQFTPEQAEYGVSQTGL